MQQSPEVRNGAFHNDARQGLAIVIIYSSCPRGNLNTGLLVQTKAGAVIDCHAKQRLELFTVRILG